MKPIKLPTLPTFLRLPLPKRAALFGRWLAAQPRGRLVLYWDSRKCPLARFGNAITRTRTCWGGGISFTLDGDIESDVDVSGHERPYGRGVHAKRRLRALCDNATYGDAADAYAATLP